MNSAAGLHLKTYLLILLMVIFGPLGNVLLGKGMKGVGVVSVSTPAEALDVLSRVLASGTIWLGIGSLISFFVAYMLVLSWADYSFVMPFSAIAYALVPLLGYLFLGERVSAARSIGIILIFLGVLLINRTPHRTTEAAKPS